MRTASRRSATSSPSGACRSSSDRPSARSGRARSPHTRARRAPATYWCPRPHGRPTSPPSRRATSCARASSTSAGRSRDFAGLGPEVSYRRRLFCVPGRFWLVADEVLGTGSFTGESLVHLHPDDGGAGQLRRTPRRRRGTRRRGVDDRAAGRCTEPRALRWRLRSGAARLARARRGRAWRPAPVIVVRAAGALPLLTGYALVPRSDAVSG